MKNLSSTIVVIDAKEAVGKCLLLTLIFMRVWHYKFKLGTKTLGTIQEIYAIFQSDCEYVIALVVLGKSSSKYSKPGLRNSSMNREKYVSVSVMAMDTDKDPKC